jgi:two-component system phosphate regulon response regulator PhoB
MSKIVAVRELVTAVSDIGPDSVPIPVLTILATSKDADSVLRELGEKIQALLGGASRERNATEGATSRAGHAEDVTAVGEMRIDRRAHRVVVNGEEVYLTAQEFKLLVALVEHQGCVVARSVLLREVWALSAFSHTRTVDTHVKRLRDKLGTAARFIHTIHGIGYRFSETAATGGAGSVRARKTS